MTGLRLVSVSEQAEEKSEGEWQERSAQRGKCYTSRLVGPRTGRCVASNQE